MPKLIEVESRPSHHLWLRYDDGAEGEVDVSFLVGRGVFRAWEDPSFFGSVSIAPHGALAWGEDIELCPDSTYMLLTGKKPEEVFPNLSKAEVDA